MNRVRAALLALLLPVLGNESMAQDYPTRQIRLIAPLAAGSSADILCRIVGAELGKRFGQAVVVENQPAASGTIAMADLAHAAPDGYTIAAGSQGTLVFNQILYSKPGYDSLKDFAPIILVGGVSNVLVVPSSSTAKSALDVIGQARSQPKMTFSSGGSGTSHHLSGVLFAQATGTDLLHVPYEGAPQGIVAVMSGAVDMGFFNTPTVINPLKEGKLRGLAVTSKERSPLLPNLPTLDEAGVKGYEMNTWFGFVAPAGTPPAIVDLLNKEIAKIVTTPAVREKLAAQGFELAQPQPPSGFSARLGDDLKKWHFLLR